MISDDKSAHFPPARRELLSIYERIWSASRQKCLENKVEVDPLPADRSMRWGISAVFRPERWPAELADLSRDLTKFIGPDHVIYDQSNFHITIKSIEGHRVGVAGGDRTVSCYAAALRRITRGLLPLAVSLRGVVGTSGGVIVQGWPDFDLQALRHSLHAEIAAENVDLWGPEASIENLRNSCHGSLVIFGGALADPARLVTFVDANRATALGDLVFRSIALIGYERSSTAVTLVEYGDFLLGGADV